MDAQSRQEFLDGFKSGGKYDGTVAIYRNNDSAPQVGVFDKDLIDAFPDSIAWIAHNGAGYDQIDVHACKAKGMFSVSAADLPSFIRCFPSAHKLTNSHPLFSGILVSNTPGAVDDATATTALYLLISALRQFARAEQNLRAGDWKSGLKPAHDPSSKTLAILGLGGIALRLVELVRPFGMRILYHSRSPNSNAPKDCEYFPAERVNEMYAQADILSVHVPLRKETEGIVGEEVLKALKPGAALINTARGKVVDEAAMIRALESGKVCLPFLHRHIPSTRFILTPLFLLYKD